MSSLPRSDQNLKRGRPRKHEDRAQHMADYMKTYRERKNTITEELQLAFESMRKQLVQNDYALAYPKFLDLLLAKSFPELYPKMEKTGYGKWNKEKQCWSWYTNEGIEE